ncbi:UDP-glycosyltransferase 87A2-like [Pistacia vera]|uniref:UDP-glycosyltransferase 87A2-like n=1 Tax=Pistacia vera TaxID=55513 RepID=UPI0012634880|nr:UDP-glycosyltransferase 87A2-like [Pistacia vera]
MDEIAAGSSSGGVRILGVVRGETGGFWTDCGWNSIREGVFAGMPFLSFPIGMDQITNSKSIEEDFKIGWRVRKETRRVEILVKRDAIMELLRKFVDMESIEVKEMRKRAKNLQELYENAIAEAPNPSFGTLLNILSGHRAASKNIHDSSV